MPSPLNVLPNGLLGFLQLKNGGQFPQLLGTQLNTNLELLDWYLETNLEVIVSAAINQAVSANPSSATFPELTVPNREFWYVSQYIVGFGNSATGTIATCRPAAFRRTAGGSVGAVETSHESVTLAANQREFVPLARKIILGPGDSLGYVCGAVATATVPVSGTASFSRLTI